MRIAYIGKIQLSDVDLSYLHEAQKIMDITYFMEVSPRFMNGAAFSISKIYPKSGIFKAVDIYPELKKNASFIDTDKFYVINTCGRFWLLKSFITYLQLLFKIIKMKVNVVHLVWPPNIYEFILYTLRKKMLMTVHDPFPHTGLNTRIVRFRRFVAFKLIPKLIVLNKTQLDKFIDYYKISPKRIIQSQLSIYTYLRTIKPQENFVHNTPYILFFGKLSKYKGIEYLLNAMETVHKSSKNCNLIIAGSGSFTFNMDEYKGRPYITIINRFITENELVALISHSKFVVCPYTDATQSGVVMSSFAFSKPVIATNVGALPEMVINKKFGIIVPPKDSNSLSEAIIDLWINDKLCNELSANINKFFENGSYSWKYIVTKMYEEYSRI